jgi:hypothetical protein
MPTRSKQGAGADAVLERLAAIRGTTEEELAKMPAARRRRVQFRARLGDLPRARAEFAALLARDERGEVPVDATARAARSMHRQASRVAATFSAARADGELLASRVAGTPVGRRAGAGALLPRAGCAVSHR